MRLTFDHPRLQRCLAFPGRRVFHATGVRADKPWFNEAFNAVLESSQVNEIERVANWLSDLDAGWWPFLFLRPPKNRPINSWVVFKMWLFFAPIYGIGLLLASSLLHRTLQSGLDWTQLLFATLIIFGLYRVTFAVFWNRRATRLALVRELDWRSQRGNWG